jgi:ribosomal protein L16 Arg81 hydroxylase
LIVQVRGSKRIVLLPPSETTLLYNHRHVFSDVHDITDEEMLRRYPLAAQAQRYEVDLEAGDMIYLPVGWWHQVTATDFSITFTFTDFRWDNDPYATFPYE